ncbi:MAG TPA: formate/nitrite transporter family protein [Pirellulales bacterium]|jgi:formate/nitrite transporter FocA (FNT family)|nr:formate/nitrite transporter family protein [Pirellulales bacterium]
MPTPIKNPDDLAPKKSSNRIFRQEVAEGVDALERPMGRLMISAFAAGIEIGLSLLLLGIVKTLAEGALDRLVFELLMALMYSFGFIVVILGRSELFTEQTTLAILPLLAGKTTFGKVARLWVVVLIGNVIGAAVCAAWIVWVATSMKVAEASAFEAISTRIVEHPGWVILLSGVMAGWLMGLVSWLVAAARDTTSQIIIIWIVTAAIGLSHSHHAVLGSVEVLGGYFAGGQTTLAQYGYFLLCTTIGNALGGVFFVAVLKNGHAAPEKGSA